MARRPPVFARGILYHVIVRGRPFRERVLGFNSSRHFFRSGLSVNSIARLYCGQFTSHSFPGLFGGCFIFYNFFLPFEQDVYPAPE
jgi:hypothetical protein